MQRRDFTLGIGALVTGGAAPAMAGIDTSFIQGSLSAVRMRFEDGETDTIQQVEITDGSQAVGVRWSQHLPTYNENRVDLSDSAAGSFLRTPFGRRWRDATPIGGIEKVGDRLVLRVTSLAGYAGRHSVIGAGDYSWDVPLPLTDMPIAGGRGRPVGALRIGDDNRLLLQIRARPVF